MTVRTFWAVNPVSAVVSQVRDPLGSPVTVTVGGVTYRKVQSQRGNLAPRWGPVHWHDAQFVFDDGADAYRARATLRSTQP